MNRKKKIFLGAVIGFMSLMILVVVGFTARTDITALQGSGSLRNIDVWRIDSTGGIHLATSTANDALTVTTGSGDLTTWAGDVKMGNYGPTVTAGGYPGLKVKFFNGGGTTALGSVIIASVTTNAVAAVAYGTTASVLSTTTVIGVADGTYANGTYGWMTVSGYALVLTTGVVHLGDLLVSSNSVSAGWAGATPTATTGCDFAVALSTTASTGGTVLAKLR